MTNPTHLLNYDNGYFLVLEYAGKDSKYNAHTWKCQCRCGNIRILRTDVIKSKSTKSCGCSRIGKNPFVKGHKYGKRFEAIHGLSNHPLYRLWSHIKERCYKLKSKDKAYKYYRGKGIKMDTLWLYDFKAFYNWAITNGWEKGLSIDRIDSEGNYEPENCQFITMQQNSKKMAMNNPVFGQHNGNSVLTLKDVIEIRKRLQNKESGYKISLDFNVDRKTIYNIRDRKSWKNV